MIGIEHARGGQNGGVMHHDHFAPMTWPTCVSDGCTTRVDPWDHNTRCPAHRPSDAEIAADIERMRRIHPRPRVAA